MILWKHQSNVKMWFTYLIVGCVFLFLSQLSGLPQAMFYHLHWTVALPMAFLGFLILIPGLIREIIMSVIWPLFRPFVQLFVEAIGFVRAESESFTSEVPTSTFGTIEGVCRRIGFELLPVSSPPPLRHRLDRRIGLRSIELLVNRNVSWLTME